MSEVTSNYSFASHNETSLGLPFAVRGINNGFILGLIKNPSIAVWPALASDDRKAEEADWIASGRIRDVSYVRFAVALRVSQGAVNCVSVAIGRHMC